MCPKITLAALLLLMSLLAVSCIPANSPGMPAEVTVMKKELKTGENGQAVLLVTVKNTGRVKADFTEVAVKFYDAGKNLLDTGRDAVLMLNPGEMWDFTITCNATISRVAVYEVTTTTGNGGE